MAWIYLAESVESVSPLEITLDPSPIAKSTLIVKEYCCLEWHVGNYKPLQFGMTCKHSEKTQGHFLLIASILSTVAFHARISALQDLEKAWKESAADCFSRSFAWPKKSSPSSYSLKTSRQSQQEGDFKLLMNLPRWGMIVDGVLYPLRPLERSTKEIVGSYWPTPQSRAQSDTPSERRRNTPCLHSSVLLATPTASQGSKPIRAPSPSRVKGKHGEDLQDSIGRLNPESIGKRLSVEFVELLMGYRSMWTDLEDSATQYVLNKRKKRSKS